MFLRRMWQAWVQGCWIFFPGVLARVPDRPDRYGVRYPDGLAPWKRASPFLYSACSIVALLLVQNHMKPAYIDSWGLAVSYSLSEEPCKDCKDRHSFVTWSQIILHIANQFRLNWNPFFPSFLFFHPHFYSSDSFQSGLWELRVFPLKDEEVEALLCQDQITNQTEMSSAAFPSDSLCTSCTPIGLPDNGHPPRKQSTEESEDCENVCLGINNTRKQRWQGIMWFIKKAN